MCKTILIILFVVYITWNAYALECGTNEQETSCVNSVCEYRNCTDIGKPIRCIRLDPKDCIKGCICIENYLRENNGTCIEESRCSKSISSSSASSSAQSLSTGDYSSASASSSAYAFSESSDYLICDCSEEDTPICPVNEIYDECPVLCPPKRCDVDERIIRCKAPPKLGDPECEPGCRCIDNYYRNDKNVCVPKDKCPPKPSIVCEPDEQYSTCANGGCRRWSCSQSGIICVDLIEGGCIEGCICKDGYTRADNGTCIPEDKCPSICPVNEIYDECPVLCPPKRCDVDERIIRCKAPPKLGDPECEPGCRCIDNYYRNDKNVCVPKNKCPVKCKNNEIFDPCPPKCPPQECGVDPAVILCLPNAEIGDPSCEPGCRCKDGYYKNDFGDCVPKDKCPPKPSIVCDPDEQYSTCANGGCRRWSCSQSGIICVDLIEGGCVEGCICKDGYARADNGTCIPEDKCPLYCYAKDEVPGCEDNCDPQTCESIGKFHSCPLKPVNPPCNPVCRCKPGYYRNKLGDCISKQDCLKCIGPHEYFSCGPACDNECYNLSQQNITNCPIVNIKCNEKCYCEDGYARNNKKICVPYSKCPPPVVCKLNEEYSTCANGGCRRWSCSQPGILCKDPFDGGCTEGCVCKDGYTRADDGTCIPEDKCPLKCYGQNEVAGCEDNCDPQTCESIGKPYNCPLKPINAPCNPVCRCKPGFYRNKLGNCISKQNCLKCTGPHEFYSCGGACDNECYNLSQQNQTSCPIINIKCNEKCYCEDGYARNDKKICVPYSKCPPTKPPIVCKSNEQYSTCSNGGCRRWSCSQPGILCKDPIKGGCTEGCICKDGYTRADDGTCIPEDKCPLKCYGENEVAGCEDNCDPQTCESIGKRYNCPLKPVNPPCNAVCRCKPGYYRNQLGNCISKQDCLKCTGPHEYFSCGPECDNECYNLSQQNQTSCPNINIKCNEKCYCEDGYARNDKNICVPYSECPPTKPPIVCKSNEQYSTCSNGGCRRWSCSQSGIICADILEGSCTEGCVCKDGYTRADDGTCIPEDKCPLKCYGENEVAGCEDNCDPQTCESIGKRYNCPLKPVNPPCNSVCRCKPGYYRNKLGNCISKQNCLKCTGPHEYFSCGPECDNECYNLSEQNITNCPIINIQCNEKCYCEDSYARNDKNICVPYSKCPPPKPQIVCNANEQYSTCANGGCRRWSCSQPGILCIDLFEGGCTEGCVCKDGYARADDGTCIPEDKCPLYCYGQHEVPGCEDNCDPQTCESIGKFHGCPLKPANPPCNPVCRCKPGYYRNKLGDCISKQDCLKCTGPHEYFSCGGACDNECYNLSQQNQTSCPIINIKCNDQCYCEDGYARDNKKNCVPYSKCPPPVVCGLNEEYSTCANGGCRKWRCSQPGILCIDPINCEGGCVCKDGYSRADDGKCIPVDKCPLTCYGQNEVPVCDNSCDPQTCESIGKLYNCPFRPSNPPCNPVCRCKPGYYRNKIGDCISKQNCLKCTGPHEYFSCGPVCDNECYNLRQQNQTSCPFVNKKCNEKCYCEDGYARDIRKICVPYSKCLPRIKPKKNIDEN